MDLSHFDKAMRHAFIVALVLVALAWLVAGLGTLHGT